MRRRLCAAILTFEAIVLGLTTPVLISVQGVDHAQALWTGLGLLALCLVTAGLLRWTWAYGLGWLVQVAAVVLGLQITAMFVLGVVFAALWIAAYLLGGRIDDHEAEVARVQAAETATESEPVRPPRQWQYELACDDDTYRRFVRPFGRSGAGAVLRPPLLVLPLLCVLVGVLVIVLSPGNALVGGLLVALAVAWPVVSWLAQRQAWKSFLASGRSYRTTFEEDRLVLESDGRLLEVRYDDVETVSAEHGLVSADVTGSARPLQLPEDVFPPAEQDRLRRRAVRRPADDDEVGRS